jgi:hypothetical protein
MTWTGQSFSVGQILTAAQMTNLQADITALANGDSGAPTIISPSPPSRILDDAITTDGAQSIGAGAAWTIPQGFHNLVSLHASGADVQIYVNAAWRAGLTTACGAVFSDGTNMRLLNNTGVSISTYWQRFDG